MSVMTLPHFRKWPHCNFDFEYSLSYV